MVYRPRLNYKIDIFGGFIVKYIFRFSMTNAFEKYLNYIYIVEKRIYDG